MADALLIVDRLVIGLIFVVAGSQKLLHPAHFARTLTNMGVTLAPASLLVRVLLPPTELVLGTMLAAGLFVMPAALLIDVLLVCFIVAAGVFRMQPADCGCFGWMLNAPNRRALVRRDLLLLLLSLPLVLLDGPAFGDTGVFDYVSIVLVVAAVGAPDFFLYVRNRRIRGRSAPA